MQLVFVPIYTDTIHQVMSIHNSFFFLFFFFCKTCIIYKCRWKIDENTKKEKKDGPESPSCFLLQMFYGMTLSAAF